VPLGHGTSTSDSASAAHSGTATAAASASSRIEASGLGLRGSRHLVSLGLDPIIGLAPAIGDLISPLFTIAILWQSRDLEIPRVVRLRMLLNVGIDTLVGFVPVGGDLFDFAWKANDKNLALLEHHAFEEHSPLPGDWLFAGAMVTMLLALAAVPFVLAWWIVRSIGW